MANSSNASGMNAERFKTFLLTRGPFIKKDIKAALLKEGNRLAAAQRASIHSRSGATARSVRVIEGRQEVRQVSGGKPRSGKLKGETTQSNGTFTNDLVVQVAAGGPETTTGGYDHANAEEWGTYKMPAQPFFFPPYRAMKASIESNIGQAIHASIDANMR